MLFWEWPLKKICKNVYKMALWESLVNISESGVWGLEYLQLYIILICYHVTQVLHLLFVILGNQYFANTVSSFKTYWHKVVQSIDTLF